jgi:mono-ADP-ribosyltransferase sirtuin 6
MADTASAVAEREIRDAPDAVTQKATKLAKLIKESKHFIVFTGAGISTSAGTLTSSCI